MNELLEENARRINEFDSKYYFDNKNLQAYCALKALKTGLKIQYDYYSSNENLSINSNVTRLYALLQGLFVSIDSLYSLAYGITKSKNFININSNENLRKLKYIRNNVVGHPSNRVINSDIPAYCILDDNSINKHNFTYYIYCKNKVDKYDISIDDILNSYYKEANDVLDCLDKASVSSISKGKIEEAFNKVYKMFINDEDILNGLDELNDIYYKVYNNSKNRVMFRINLIKQLLKFNTNSKDESDIIKYCIYLEFVKLDDLVSTKKLISYNSYKLPKVIKSLYVFFGKNPNELYRLQYLKDLSNPMFLTYLNDLKNIAIRYRWYEVLKYFDMLFRAFKLNDAELVYAIALPIKEYNKK